MADDVTVDNGTLTDYDVRTDEDAGGKHYQFVKLAYGPLGTFTHVEAGVGLPVAIVGTPTVTVSGSVTVAEPVSIDDNGGSITVDGTVSLGAGSANIGDVDVLTVPAPLNVVGGGTEAAALRVTIASDSTGLLSVDDNGGSLTVDGTVIVTATDLDIRNLDVAQDDVRVGGMAALDAAVADNPVAVGGRASTAIPTAVSADGDAVWLWLDRSGGVVMNGRDAHDAALNANTNPLLVGARAQATVPTDVSADGDAVRLWALRSGALATVLTAAGALIGGDATNGLDVDVTRVTGTVTVDSEMSAAAALTDNFANPTAGGVGAFAMGWDGTNWDRIRAPGGVVEVSSPSALTVSATDLDIRNLDVAQDDVRVGGMAALDAAVADNPVTIGGRASTAVPTAVSADGDAVWAWLDRRGAVKTVMVDDAGDSIMDGTNDALRVNVVAGSGGATQYAEDTASAAGESVIMVGVVRKDSAASLVDADSDRTELQVDASGSLRVTGGGGGTEYTEDIAAPADPVGNAQLLRRRDTPASEATTAGDWIAQNANQYGAAYAQIVTSAGAFVDSFGGGTQYDEDTVSAAADKLTMAGVVRKDTAATLVDTDGDRTQLQVDATGRLWVDVGNTVTVAGTVAVSSVSGSVTVTDSEKVADNAAFTDGTTKVQPAGFIFDEVAGTALTENDAAAARIDAKRAQVFVLEDETSRGLRATVTLSNALKVDASFTPLQVNSLTPGTSSTNLGKAEDAGHSSGDVGVMALAVRNDAGTAFAADNDYVPLSVDSVGGVRVAVPSPLSTTGGGTEAAAHRVTIANDSTGVLSVDDNGGSLTVDQATAANLLATVTQGPAGTAWEVVGDVAHDAAAPANPVVIGAQMETMADSAPGTRSSADGDATKFATLDGAQYVITTGPQTVSYHDDDVAAVTTDGTIHAAPGAGLSLYITDIIFSIGVATASSIFIEESTTKVLGPYYLEAIAGRGLAIHFVTPKKITANTAALVTNTGATTFSIDILGFIAPG